MNKLEKGHCIILSGSRYIILETNNEKAFVTHISDPNGIKGRWVLKSLLPVPLTKINI